MPGMFGGIGAEGEIVQRLEEAFKAIWPESAAVSTDRGRIGAHAFRKDGGLGTTPFGPAVVDGDYDLYRRLRSASELDCSELCQLSGGWMMPHEEVGGNVALISDGVVHLSRDSAGAFPLYYTSFGEGLLFSSHLRPLARTLNAQPDRVGVLELVRGGYTIGGRTAFRGIHLLPPGRVLRFSPGTREAEVRDTSEAWREGPLSRSDDADALADRAWALLTNGLETRTPEDRVTGLMMSAGWDSRLLLAGLTEARRREHLVCYSHGDLGSREISLARRIASDQGVRHRLEPINNNVYDPELLERGFERVESLIFPHWLRAGALLADEGVSCGMSGVYGGILGGHYGTSSSLSGVRKAVAVVPKILSGRDIGGGRVADVHQAVDFLRVPEDRIPWYLDRDFGGTELMEEMNADIEAAARQIAERPVDDPQSLVEAFHVEHRGAQYMNAQTLSLRGAIDVTNPFGWKDMLTLASLIPIEAKIHNRMDRRMLSRHSPALLSYPMAATLATAGAPLWLQELSRVARKAREKVTWKLYFKSSGRIPAPRFGWVNFEFLRDGTILQALIDDLRLDWWDRSALERMVERVKSMERDKQLHPIFDQLGKIMTVDHMLRPIRS